MKHTVSKIGIILDFLVNQGLPGVCGVKRSNLSNRVNSNINKNKNNNIFVSGTPFKSCAFLLLFVNLGSIFILDLIIYSCLICISVKSSSLYLI